MHKSTFMAACAEIDITPNLPITLAGSLTERTANSIADPLFARLLLMSNGTEKLIFILCDLIGISNEDANFVRQNLRNIIDIPLANICIACTHTHSAPTPLDSFNSHKEAAFMEQTLQKIITAATALPTKMQLAEVAWGAGYENRPQYNRRYMMQNGYLKTNPGKNNPNILRPAGPTDPTFPLLMIRQNDGTPLAILASYSLHYVGADSSDVISADYFGAFARQIKRRFGDQCIALLAHGLSGDINNVNAEGKPEPWFPQDAKPSQKCEIVAAMLADQAQQVWDKSTFIDDVPIAATESTFIQKVRKTKKEEIPTYRAIAEDKTRSWTERIFAREKIILLDYPDIQEMSMATWRVGNWSMATFPGQMFAQCALDLRYVSPFEVIAPVELANGWGGYVGRHFDYIPELQGYEIQAARSSSATHGTGEEMLHRAIKMLFDILGDGLIS